MSGISEKSEPGSRAQWQAAYDDAIAGDDGVQNHSGIEIQPLYSPRDWSADRYDTDLGYPGRAPFTRGIYPTMHRGRPWSQRQLIGLGTPEQYNARLRSLLASGVTAASLAPCNSVLRGYDADTAPKELLGTCGTVVNNIDDMEGCFAAIPLDEISTALNDPSPFTLLAFLLGVARRRGIPWESITGTSNQSDYLSHFIANHMFYRLALPGSRRVFVDHVAFCREQVPQWNPVSVVGQHMQQAGATPAEAMALTLCTALQYADDCIGAGMEVDTFLPRFTFFFDVSISVFEEVAKFRAGRRIWARLARERLGAADPRSWRFKFHTQTSGVDLTRQQPLNNIARVAIQALGGILGGAQSLHTDAYDEALTTPTAGPSRIAVNTQNILREEAHLDKVIDPLGGSFYVETLTNEMELLIDDIIAKIDDAGGMYRAAETGLVQQMIGRSALDFQGKIESGEQTVVGVNAYQVEEEAPFEPPPQRLEAAAVDAYLARLAEFKAARSVQQVRSALDGLRRAANDSETNVFAQVVEAAAAGCTHGEICDSLRDELGFGQPLVVV
ncbi:MAG: methylmalonyl-CoA mutase [Acidimicrobiia bacterium]